MNIIRDWGLLQKVHAFLGTSPGAKAPEGMTRRDFLRYTKGAAIFAAAPGLFIPPQKIFTPGFIEGTRYAMPMFSSVEFVAGAGVWHSIEDVIMRDSARDIIAEEDRRMMEFFTEQWERGA